jgi:hypothetical protein
LPPKNNQNLKLQNKMAKSGTFALTGTDLEKFQQTNKETEEPTK